MPIKGATPKVVDWTELLAAFGSNRDVRTKMTLRQLRPGAFLGIAKNSSQSAESHNFVLFNPDRSAKFDWVLKKDPTFEQRLVEVYRVEDVVWESVVKEFDASNASTRIA